MARSLKISLSCLAVTVGAILITSHSADISWDLSSNRLISAVSWPSDQTGHLYTLPGKRRFALVVAPDIRFEKDVTFIQVERKADRVRFIFFHLPEDTSAGVTRVARDLIQTLNLQRYGTTERAIADLQDWQAQADHPAATRYLASRTDDDFSIDVGILHAFDPKKPWYIQIAVSFPDRQQKSRPASTKSATQTSPSTSR